MPDLWMPGVERQDTGRRLTMQGQNNARIFTWHTFEAPYSLTMYNAWRYLRSQGSDPHFVFHPITGELVQMLPANTGGRTLRAPQHPRVQTNTYGKVHMQVEVIAYAKNPWTSDLTPAGKATLARLLDFLRSWGIPDQWCGGVSPSRYAGEKKRFMPNGSSGHTGHSLWLTNDHWDPGGIVAPWSIGGSTPKPPPAPEPEPEKPGWETPTHIKAVQGLLNNVTAAGLDVDGISGPKTEAATTAYQKDKATWGHNLDADGKPGPLTRTALEKSMASINDLDKKLDRTLVEIAAVRAHQKKWSSGYLKVRLENLRLQLNTLVAAEDRKNAPAGEPSED